MFEIFNFKKNQPVVWFHRIPEKSNHYCLYCGEYVGPSSEIKSNKEHLIAREFIPGDYLSATDFNFIFRCCEACNTRKSNIERHLSTTTLLNSESRVQDEKINLLALNKAKKDFHPDHKGQLVFDSNVRLKYEFEGVGINTVVGFVAPPQSNEDYVIELAYRHMQGLFSLFNSENPRSPKTTYLLPFENFHLIGIYTKRDWGNTQIAYCVNRTLNWDLYCNICIANGYFKALLLRSDQVHEGWFWALEWNKSVRILGALVKETDMGHVYAELPELSWSPWRKTSKGEFRYRVETPLSEKDTLFRENSE